MKLKLETEIETETGNVKRKDKRYCKKHRNNRSNVYFLSDKWFHIPGNEGWELTFLLSYKLQDLVPLLDQL